MIRGLLLIGFVSVLAFSSGLALAVQDKAAPLVTPAPVAPHLLEKRDVVTWAYISGDSNSPLTCSSGLTTSNSLGNTLQACCNAVTCLNDWETCLPYGQTCTYLNLPCSDSYNSWVSCNSQTPGCITYKSITGPNDLNGLTSYACGPSNTVILALGAPAVAGAAATTTNVYDPLLPTVSSTTASISIDSVSFGSESLSLASAESAPTATTTSSSSTSGLSNTGGGDTPTSPSGKLDTGSIVGIVGGVIGFLAILAAIWLKWPRTITRFLTCGVLTTVDDDALGRSGHHGVPMRYVPQTTNAAHNHGGP